MARAFITWDEDVVRLDEVDGSRHPHLSGKGFYAVLAATLDEEADLWRGLRLLLIGQSGQNTLRGALTDEGQDFGPVEAALREGEEAIVMLGTIESTLGRMTAGFLDDVITCLVFRHRAVCNERLKGPYTGRKISVVNRGDFQPLKPKCLLRPSKDGSDSDDDDE